MKEDKYVIDVYAAINKELERMKQKTENTNNKIETIKKDISNDKRTT